jgi:hypothetical protein
LKIFRGAGVGAEIGVFAEGTADVAFANAAQAIEHALAEPAYLEFIETSLSKFNEYLRDFYGIDVTIDSEALHEWGIESDWPVTINIRGESLDFALMTALRDGDLGYEIRDDQLMITTRETSDPTQPKELVKLYQRLVEQSPDEVGYRRGLAAGYFLLGERYLYLAPFDADAFGDSKQAGDAREALEAARAIYSSLLSTPDGNNEDRFGLARALLRLGSCARSSGDVESAWALWEKSRELLERLEEADFLDGPDGMELYFCYDTLAGIEEDRGRLDPAIQLHRAKFRALKRLPEEEESPLGGLNFFGPGMLIMQTHERIAELYHRQGQHRSAGRQWTTAVQEADPRFRPHLSMRRAVAIALVGRHDLACQVAAELLEETRPWEDDRFSRYRRRALVFDAARVFALASAAGDGGAESDQLAARSVECLVKAADVEHHDASLRRGYLFLEQWSHTYIKLEDFREHEHFESLQRRSDYQQLIRQIEARDKEVEDAKREQ